MVHHFPCPLLLPLLVSSVLVHGYTIERVRTYARAFDVQVFRGESLQTVEEYMTNHHLNSNNNNSTCQTHVLEQVLMKGLDQYGNNPTIRTPHHGPILRFVAISSVSSDAPRTHGVIGCCFCQVRRPLNDEPNYCYLYNLLVSPKYRRRGIGLALVQAVVEYAAASGDTSSVVLTVDCEKNPAVVPFYEQAGFVVTNTTFKDATRMERTLELTN